MTQTPFRDQHCTSGRQFARSEPDDTSPNPVSGERQRHFTEMRTSRRSGFVNTARDRRTIGTDTRGARRANASHGWRRVMLSLIRNKRLNAVNNNELNLTLLGLEIQTELLPESGKHRIRE